MEKESWRHGKVVRCFTELICVKYGESFGAKEQFKTPYPLNATQSLRLLRGNAKPEAMSVILFLSSDDAKIRSGEAIPVYAQS